MHCACNDFTYIYIYTPLIQNHAIVINPTSRHQLILGQYSGIYPGDVPTSLHLMLPTLNRMPI